MQMDREPAGMQLEAKRLFKCRELKWLLSELCGLSMPAVNWPVPVLSSKGRCSSTPGDGSWASCPRGILAISATASG